MLATAAFAGSGCAPKEPGSSGPGALAPVVLVSLDTLRADAFDADRTWADGGDTAAAMQAWMNDSIVFSNAFAHAPSTLPSHASLFSGRDIGASGIVENGQVVPNSLPLLAEQLQASDYQTRAVVSIGTLWSDDPGRSLERGFEQYDQDFGADGLTHLARASQTLPRVRESLESLEADRPPFLFLHFADPHAPYHNYGTGDPRGGLLLDGELWNQVDLADSGIVDEELNLKPGAHALHLLGPDGVVLRNLQMFQGDQPLAFEITHGRRGKVAPSVRWEFKVRPDAGPVRLRLWASDLPVGDAARRRYGREVDQLALHLDDLRDMLIEADLWSRAWVVLVGDHGEGLGQHDNMDHVISLYDELLRVPLLIKPPSSSPTRRTLELMRDELVGLADLTPTLLDALELPALPGATGMSLLQPMAASQRRLAFETHAPQARADQVALRSKTTKLIYRPTTGIWELYDMTADPAELQNRFSSAGAPEGWVEQLEALGTAAQAHEHLTTERERQRLEALGYSDGE